MITKSVQVIDRMKDDLLVNMTQNRLQQFLCHKIIVRPNKGQFARFEKIGGGARNAIEIKEVSC